MSSSREMDHTEAIETMAAQRYVLDEMTPEDRDAFEEHFFGCAECHADVKDGETIADTLRREKATVHKFEPRKSSYATGLAAAAAIALIAFLGFQNATMRRATEAALKPRLVASHSLQVSQTRGEEEKVFEAKASEAFTLDFDIPPQPNAQRYVVEIVDASKRVRMSEPVTLARAQDVVYLLVPAGALSPGRYQLRIRTEPAGAPDLVSSFKVR